MIQSSKRFASLILSLVLLGAAAIMYFNFVVPAYSDLQALRGDEAAHAQLVSEEQAAVAKVQSLIASYKGQGAVQNTVSAALPLTPDVAGALLQLNGIAGITGVTLRSVSVVKTAPLVPQQGAGQSSTEPLLNARASLGTLAFNVQAEGSYESIKQFISDMETNVRIFSVSTLSIVPISSAQASSAVRGTSDDFTATFTVVAYYQIS